MHGRADSSVFLLSLLLEKQREGVVFTTSALMTHACAFTCTLRACVDFFFSNLLLWARMHSCMNWYQKQHEWDQEVSLTKAKD